jgi:hypothetical protein
VGKECWWPTGGNIDPYSLPENLISQRLLVNAGGSKLVEEKESPKEKEKEKEMKKKQKPRKQEAGPVKKKTPDEVRCPVCGEITCRGNCREAKRCF